MSTQERNSACSRAQIDRVAWHAAGGGANGIGVATIHESAIWGMETLLTAVSSATALFRTLWNAAQRVHIVHHGVVAVAVQ